MYRHAQHHDDLRDGHGVAFPNEHAGQLCDGEDEARSKNSSSVETRTLSLGNATTPAPSPAGRASVRDERCADIRGYTPGPARAHRPGTGRDRRTGRMTPKN
jgi:hypothetical protein